MDKHVAGCLLTVVCLCSLSVTETARAEKIQLKDGQQFDGQVLQKDGERVVVGFARDAVAAVDGKSLPPPVTAGTNAPDFTATDLSGAPQSMAQNRGHATLLQFWASWCPHCRSDLSKIKALYVKEQPRGFRLVTVSVDQNVDDLKKIIAKEQLSYPIISAKDYPDIQEKYEMQGIPAYFLVNAKGVIAKTWSGSLTEGSNTDFDAELTKLLTASPAKP